MEERVKKWLREHPKVQVYVSKEEYEALRELSERMSLSISELIKKAILDIGKLRDEAYGKGFDDGWERAENEIKKHGPFEYFGIEEFTVPCPKCGKPMIFLSKDEKWKSEVKPILKKAFANWYHAECLKE